MELGKQIHYYRTQKGLSQEQLAAQLFVSRQSVSNWERGATYPDIQTLLLLSHTFEISLDTLIKEDILEMKQIIHQADHSQYEKDSKRFALLLILLPILIPPLALFLGWYGLAIALVLWAVSLSYAFRIEDFKKKHNLQTYKELIAYDSRTALSERERIEEKAKHPYQKIIIVACVTLLTLLLSLVSLGLSSLFF